MNIQKILSLRRIRPLNAWQGDGGFPRPAEHSGISKARIAAFAFLLFMTSLLVGLPNAYGHYIEPTGTIEVKVGDTFEIAFHPSGEWDECIVFASVSVDDPDIVSGGGEKTEHFPIFTMQALATGTAYITTYFYGIGPECPDSDEKILTVEVAPSVTPTTAANYISSSDDGDPVNTFTGELFDDFPPDLFLGGPMPLYLSRYYASGLKQSGVAGRLGDNWRHNFEWSMSVIGTDATIINHRCKIITFSDDGSAWNLTGNMAVPYQLVESGGDYVLYDPDARLLYTFDSAGNLIAIGDGKGNTLTLAYSGSDLSTVSDGLDRTLTFTYSAGKLSTITDDTRTVSFGYTADDLTSYTDALGNVTAYTYDTGGLMTARTLPNGNSPYTQTYNGDGKVATQTDADGNTFSFDYSGLDTTLTGPLGNTRVHTHTANGEFSNRQDQVGLSFSMGSDATGRRNSLTDRLGNTTTIDYHAPSGNISAVGNADGTTSGFSYTERLFAGLKLYDITTVIHADGTSESMTYDTLGNATSYTDQMGNTAIATYNGNGQPLSVTNVAGGTTTNTYNADGTLLTITDPAGNTTTYGYDSLKRLNLITFADGNTQNFTYNNLDQLVTITDGNGNSSTYSYDANSNLATATDALGNTITFGYDGNDRLLSITDPLGGIISTTYDALGRPDTITDENFSATTLGYDILGRHISTTDSLGYVWSQTYNAEAILASSTDPLGNTTTFVSDAMGRITETTSPLGNVSRVIYDAMGRVTSITDPLGNTTTFSRDPFGLLSGITLPGGAIGVTYTRNGLGNITQITDPNGNNWQSGYNNQGLCTSRTDPLGNLQTVGYDSRNRPAIITYADGVIQTLGYDPAGNLTSCSYSGGGTVFNYRYDANDRLVSANDGPGTPDNLTQSYDEVGCISNSNGIAMGRDAGGRIISMTLASGKTVTYGYDANDNLISVTDWAGATTTFDYDADDSLIRITRPAANGVDTSYAYDKDGRLVGLDEDRGAVTISSIALTRDANGQITQAIRNTPQPASAGTSPSTTHSFDAASQIASAGFVYDACGRLTDDGTKTYTWDAASRLSSVTEGMATITYTYDALGQRLSRSSGGLDRRYVWNSALVLDSISIERDGAGVDLRYFVHTPAGALLYSMDAISNARQFHHFDEMGNTIAVTDDSGTVIASYAYTPYGILTASTGALDNPFTWQGNYGVMDEGNGLYYVRARYYDATTRRFISRDPNRAMGPREVNPYQYALANPLRFVDVTGRQSVEEIVEELDRLHEDFRRAAADGGAGEGDQGPGAKEYSIYRKAADEAMKNNPKAYLLHMERFGLEEWLRESKKIFKDDPEAYQLHLQDRIKRAKRKWEAAHKAYAGACAAARGGDPRTRAARRKRRDDLKRKYVSAQTEDRKLRVEMSSALKEADAMVKEAKANKNKGKENKRKWADVEVPYWDNPPSDDPYWPRVIPH